MITSNPNKQRTAAEGSDLQQRRDAVSAHLSKELRQQYKRRSLAIRKGDEVKVVRGDHFGKSGAVTDVDTGSRRILVNGITVKRTIGTEKQVPIEPSNVVITGLNLDDTMRQRILLRKVKEVKVEKKAPTPAAEAAKAPAKAETGAGEKPPAKAEDGHSHQGHDHAAHAHAAHGQSRNLYEHARDKRPEKSSKTATASKKERKS